MSNNIYRDKDNITTDDIYREYYELGGGDARYQLWPDVMRAGNDTEKLLAIYHDVLEGNYS
jgi:hypothetical protein